MEYKYILDDVALQSLEGLIGNKLEFLYSNGLSVYKNYIESRLFILRTCNKLWINIRNQAHETPECNDYYNLIITESEVPEDLIFDKTHNSIVFPYGKISLKSSVIKSIEIYNRNEIYGREELYYDALILFNCNGDFKFMICVEERVDEPLIFSSNFKVIKTYLDGLDLRITLGG